MSASTTPGSAQVQKLPESLDPCSGCPPGVNKHSAAPPCNPLVHSQLMCLLPSQTVSILGIMAVMLNLPRACYVPALPEGWAGVSFLPHLICYSTSELVLRRT